MKPLINWILGLFCEPEPEPQPDPMARMLATLVGWRHPEYRLRFECDPHHGFVKLILELPGSGVAESYLIGIHSDAEIAGRLMLMQNHIDRINNKPEPDPLASVLDFSYAGRDC